MLELVQNTNTKINKDQITFYRHIVSLKPLNFILNKLFKLQKLVHSKNDMYLFVYQLKHFYHMHNQHKD